MASRAAKGKVAPPVEEARLARAAAAGDGGAFAALYERYEQSAYNLAYRLTGAEPDAADATEEAYLRVLRQVKSEDGELAFGAALLAATRAACYDLIAQRPPAPPDEAAPGTGIAGEEVGAASMRLPERQREALALRQLERLSYEEIAAIVETSPGSVAQLISRARINLRDELRGTALAGIPPSSECQRALPSIAAREDGQLQAGSEEDVWLDSHLEGCERCRLAMEAMGEAAASYRAWAPIAAVPWLLEETMAKAATLAAADWGEAIASAVASRPDPRPGAAPAVAPQAGHGRSPRRPRAIAAGLAALLLGGGVATVLAGDGSSPAPDLPAAGKQQAAGAPSSRPGSKPRRERRRDSRTTRRTASTGQATGVAGPTTTTFFPPPAPAAGGGGGADPAAPRGGGRQESGIRPPRAVAAPRPAPRPKPAPRPAPAPPPTTATAPPAEDPAPPDSTTGTLPRERAPKGRPTDGPPRVGH